MKEEERSHFPLDQIEVEHPHEEEETTTSRDLDRYR